jgi:hypothetical protein
MIFVTRKAAAKHEYLLNKLAKVMLRQNELERFLLASPLELSPIFASKARRGST